MFPQSGKWIATRENTLVNLFKLLLVYTSSLTLSLDSTSWIISLILSKDLRKELSLKRYLCRKLCLWCLNSFFLHLSIIKWHEKCFGKQPVMSPSRKHNPFCKLSVKTIAPRKKDFNNWMCIEHVFPFNNGSLPRCSIVRQTKPTYTGLTGNLEKVDRNKQCSKRKFTGLCRSLTLMQVIREVYLGSSPWVQLLTLQRFTEIQKCCYQINIQALVLRKLFSQSKCSLRYWRNYIWKCTVSKSAKRTNFLIATVEVMLPTSKLDFSSHPFKHPLLPF